MRNESKIGKALQKFTPNIYAHIFVLILFFTIDSVALFLRKVWRLPLILLLPIFSLLILSKLFLPLLLYLLQQPAHSLNLLFDSHHLVKSHDSQSTSGSSRAQSLGRCVVYPVVDSHFVLNAPRLRQQRHHMRITSDDTLFFQHGHDTFD